MLVASVVCKELSDAEILRKALEDVDYFSCIFERYEAQLLRYIQRLASMPEEEAQDILQDAFIKIWKNLHAIDSRMKISSWIFRVIHNETISWIRKRNAFGRGIQVSWEEKYDEVEAPSVVEEQVEGNKEQKVMDILNQLPFAHREILVLRFLEELSYEEISDVLKIPEGTVATRINRAKKGFAQLATLRGVQFNL